MIKSPSEETQSEVARIFNEAHTLLRDQPSELRKEVLALMGELVEKVYKDLVND